MSHSRLATFTSIVLSFLMSSALFAQAQRFPLLTATASGTSVRYAGFGEVREMRLEIFDGQGERLFDSAFTSGNLIDYSLSDTSGGRLGDGSYLFVVTLRDFAGRESQKFGTFEMAGPRVMLENTSADALSPAALAALSGRTLMPIDRIGIEMPSQPQVPIIVAPAPATSNVGIPRADVAGTGTVNRVTKWTDTGGTLGDSAITEVGGKVGIGTTTPGALLHIFGAATADVFEGMGPNVVTGPAMNYGYSGNTFGRGSGFFNVRPDAAAVPPNPSLRFMTMNLQRMIITNAGNVGIGTSGPAEKLEVSGNFRLSGGGSLIFNDATSMSTAGATLGANSFGGSQTVSGDVTASGTISGLSGSFNDVTVSAYVSALQYYLSGTRVLATPGLSGNLVVGVNAGTSLTAGTADTFVGEGAGSLNSIGSGNSFFGNSAGNNNDAGNANSYFGNFAGFFATSGGNSFFGDHAGFITNTGSSNTFIGKTSGQLNTTGSGNTFVGYFSGHNNSAGSSNTIIGYSAGDSNFSDSENTLIGGSADIAFGVTNATALGMKALVTQSDSVVLGSIAGLNTATQTAKVGIGTTAPQTRLQVESGDVYISGTGTATGLILRSPDGTQCVRLTINNAGTLLQGALTCP